MEMGIISAKRKGAKYVEECRNMSNVHLKESKAEIALAKILWERGFRYRKNYRKLPGSPDIAILKHNIAVFVDGEFWHGKDWDQRKGRLKSNREYWVSAASWAVTTSSYSENTIR